MGMVTVKVSEVIFAIGEPTDMGIYTAWYQYAATQLVNSLKEQAAKTQLAERLAREFKCVKVVPIPKKDGDPDAGS